MFVNQPDSMQCILIERISSTCYAIYMSSITKLDVNKISIYFLIKKMKVCAIEKNKKLPLKFDTHTYKIHTLISAILF